MYDGFLCEECRNPIDTNEYCELREHEEYLSDFDNVFIQHKECLCKFNKEIVLATTKTLKLVRLERKEINV